MHFDPSSCCQISVFFHTSISFWTWHCNPHSTPKQRLRLWNLHISVFAMFSFHSLILFRFCTKKIRVEEAWRRGVRPKSWLLICLCGRHWDLFWDRNCPEIYEHKVSAFRHRNAIHSDASKDSSSDLCVYACPCTWYSTRKCTCQTT